MSKRFNRPFKFELDKRKMEEMRKMKCPNLLSSPSAAAARTERIMRESM
jgi:hypothetical protein